MEVSPTTERFEPPDLGCYDWGWRFQTGPMNFHY